MKGKEKFEIIFICILILIVGGLVYIYFADLDSEYLPSSVKSLFKKYDYEIIDKIEVCENGREEFFTDDEYIYYFDCDKSKLIYLEYEDGTIKPMMDELTSGNVKIKSLIEHGLKCSKESLIEDNETNTTEKIEDAQENKTDED